VSEHAISLETAKRPKEVHGVLHLTQHFAEACYSYGVAWPPACRDVWRRRGEGKTAVSATAACCEESAASRDRGLFVKRIESPAKSPCVNSTLAFVGVSAMVRGMVLSYGLVCFILVLPSCAAFFMPVLAPQGAGALGRDTVLSSLAPQRVRTLERGAVLMSGGPGSAARSNSAAWVVGGDVSAPRSGRGMMRRFWVSDSPGKINDLHMEEGWLPAPCEGEVTVEVASEQSVARPSRVRGRSAMPAFGGSERGAARL
jgi:hypothetical protein